MRQSGPIAQPRTRLRLHLKCRASSNPARSLWLVKHACMLTCLTGG